MSNQELILYEVKNRIATITIDRPEKAHAFSIEMLQMMHSRLKEADEDELAKCILIKSTRERFFSAGYDLKEIQGAPEKINQITFHMDDLLEKSLSLADAGLIIDKTDQIDLNDLISTIAEEIVPEDIIYSQNKLPIVLGDVEKIRQIFRNLFSNAIIHGYPKNINVLLQKSKTEYIEKLSLKQR